MNGYYQLEPIPNLLEEQNINIDYAVLLTTNNTSSAKEEVWIEDLAFLETITPLEYYQIFLQKKGISEDHIFAISIDENNPVSAIMNTAEKLNELNQEDELHLFIDTHGGFRGTQMVVEAIIGLLAKDQTTNKIETTTYGIQYYGNDGQNRIIEDEAIRIFDFVSGINEFLNYGRTDSLIGFIGSNETLLKQMEDFSESVRWCNPDEMRLALQQIRNTIRRENIYNDYLRLFSNRIEQEYSGLISNDGTIDDYKTVQWLMKKGFYQQALTFIEGKMPDYYFKKNLLRTTAEGKMFCEEHRLTSADMVNGCIYKLEFSVNWWATDRCPSFNRLFTQEIDGRENQISNDIERILTSRIREINYNNLLNTAKRCSTIDHGSCAELLDFSNLDGRKLKDYCLLLIMHKTLKVIRNTSNHALDGGQERSGLSNLNQKAKKNAILYYCWLLEKIDE